MGTVESSAALNRIRQEEKKYPQEFIKREYDKNQEIIV